MATPEYVTDVVWNGSLGNISNLNPYAYLQKLNQESTIRFLPVIVFLGVLMIIGIVGNAIVAVVFCQRKRKSDMDVFLLNLAFLDFLACSFGIPFEITDLCFSYTFYLPIPCKLLRVLESWTSMASALILVIIAIDRYKHICRFGERFNRKKVKILCLVAICVSGLFSWPIFIIVGKKTIYIETSEIKGVDCSMSDEMGKSEYPLIYYGLLMFGFILCLVFVIIVYVRIFLFMRRKKAEIQNHYKTNDIGECTPNNGNMAAGDPQSVNLNQSNAKGMQMHGLQKSGELSLNRNTTISGIHITRPTMIFIVITTAFIISYLPFLVTMLLRNLIRDFEKDLSPSLQVFFKFCIKTMFINNAINPVIYRFLCREFREDVKRLFQRCACARQSLEQPFRRPSLP